MTPPDPMRCTANNRLAERCYAWAMRGQRVCRMHGGSAPQALKKAEERLRALEHPAITALAELIAWADTDATRLAAAKYALELLGHKVVVQQQTEHEVTIRVLREEQPITIEIEKNYGALSNGHTHDQAG